MPIIKSAKKALRQTKTRTVRNQKVKNNLKAAFKTANKENLSDVFSTIDKAVKVGMVHQNRAARLKSRLSKKFGAPVAKKSTSENQKTKIKKSDKKPVAKKITTKKKA